MEQIKKIVIDHDRADKKGSQKLHRRNLQAKECLSSHTKLLSKKQQIQQRTELPILHPRWKAAMCRYSAIVFALFHLLNVLISSRLRPMAMPDDIKEVFAQFYKGKTGYITIAMGTKYN